MKSVLVIAIGFAVEDDYVVIVVVVVYVDCEIVVHKQGMSSLKLSLLIC